MRHLIAMLLSALTLFGVLAGNSAVAGPPGHQFLSTRHVYEEVTNGAATPVGRLPANWQLRFDIVLPTSNPAALEKFIAAVSNPRSPTYRHYLTPAQFTARFGPSQADWNAVMQFAKASGFTVVGGSRDEMDLRLTAPVAAVEAALHVTMRTYRHPTENRVFFSADGEPSVDLQAAIWHVSGLDNFAMPHALARQRPVVAAARANATTGACPNGSYCGSDMRGAYYGNGPLTGAGQSVGLVEFVGYDIADLNTYFSTTGQTSKVPVNGISTDGTSLTCLYAHGCNDAEQILDVTQAIGMAPGLAQVNVYVGSSDSAIFSAMSVVPPGSVTGKVDAQLSCSWSWGVPDVGTDDPIFQKFAAQGQTMFVAAGDSAAYNGVTNNAFPADDAYITAVGGTDLTTVGPNGTWSAEGTWSLGGGGYILSDNIPIPTWQAAAVASFNALSPGKPASKSLRNAPDVAGEANFDFYVCANQQACQAGWGGTSFAAPMWAAYLALANQQLAQAGAKPVGFLNPALYLIGNAGGTTYSAAFHDITSGSNGFPAVTGYDVATGWGSPNGAGLINALVGSLAPSFTLSVPSAVSVPQGGTSKLSVTTVAASGYNSNIALSITGLPTGATATFAPASVAGAGTTVLTLQLGASVPVGSYALSVVGTAGAATSSAPITLTVTANGFSLSASGAVSVYSGSAATAVVTSTTTGGYATPVMLSASGQPSGVTVSFSPSTVSGTGTSTVSLQVASSVAAGNYLVTVTGAAGGISSTTGIVLAVATPGFTLSAAGTLSVVQGNTGTLALTSSQSGGFSAPISLSASGQPAGMTVAFTPATLASGNWGTTASFQVAASVAPGNYTVRLTGSSGTLSSSTNVTVVVAAAPTFVLSSASAMSLPQGGAGSQTLTTTASGGFNSVIGFSASGQPSGIGVSFSPASASGAGSTKVTVQVAATVAGGVYPITLTATSGSLVRTTTLSLTVTVPTFALSATNALSITQGQSASATIGASAAGGFVSTIALSASGQPAGMTVGFSATTIPATGSTTATVQVAAGTPVGKYPVTITGTSGALQASTTITVTVTAATYTLASASPSVAAVQGGTGSVALATTVTGVLGAPITLSASNLPVGISATFSPASITGAGTTVLALSASSSAVAGSYPITVSAISAGVTESVTITLVVTAMVPAAYALVPSTTSLSVVHGTSSTLLVTAPVTGTVASPISLSVAGLPAGVTVAFSPATIAGGGTSIVTLTASATASPVSTPVLLTFYATSGTTTVSTAVHLLVR